MYVIFDDLLYIRLYLCFYSMIFLSFITMAIPLAVSVVHVLSILAVSVLLPSVLLPAHNPREGVLQY